jgi:DNA gyrase inhibitor GyrI
MPVVTAACAFPVKQYTVTLIVVSGGGCGEFEHIKEDGQGIQQAWERFIQNVGQKF